MSINKVLSDDEIIEIKRCVDDPIYMIENFIKIHHPINGVIPFKLFDYQQSLIQDYQDNNSVIGVVGRQVGATTCSIIYLLWYAMFNPNSNILITAPRYKESLEIMKRIRFSYESLPDYLKEGTKYYSMERIGFDNNSTIEVDTITENTGRGETISILYVSDFAFAPPKIAYEFWRSICPTLSTGGKCFIASAPSSEKESQFEQIFKNTKNNGFYPITVHWSQVPGRDSKWAAKERASLGNEVFLREHCNQFV